MDVPSLMPLLLAHVIPFTLVLFRLAGLFLLAPLLTSTMIPMKFRALLACTFAAAAYPILAPDLIAPASADMFSLVPLIAGEALIGLCVGAIASMPLLSLELAGVVMGQSMGFGLARVYNPESDVETDLLGQLLLMVATGVFVASGGLETLFTGLVRSFDRLPIGGMSASSAPLDLFIDVLTSGCDLALRVAMPVVGGTMLLVIVLGVIGKTMPQVNIMSVGFTIKVLAGLAALALAMSAIRETVGDAIDQAIDQALLWLSGLGSGSLTPGGHA